MIGNGSAINYFNNICKILITLLIDRNLNVLILEMKTEEAILYTHAHKVRKYGMMKSLLS
jgi:hypothetical protein